MQASELSLFPKPETQNSPICMPLNSEQPIPIGRRELVLMREHVGERTQDERERRPNLVGRVAPEARLGLVERDQLC